MRVVIKDPLFVSKYRNTHFAFLFRTGFFHSSFFARGVRSACPQGATVGSVRDSARDNSTLEIVDRSEVKGRLTL